MQQEDSHPTNLHLEHTVALSPRQWMVVAVIVVVGCCAAVRFGREAELYKAVPNYRIPYELAEDYWLTRYQISRQDRQDVVLMGDSVIWGEYVRPTETLSAYLNQSRVLSTSDSAGVAFHNVGLNGLHPLAMEGFANYYCSELSDRPVILYLNLLWLSSPQRDLQTGDSEIQYNHPELVPQWPGRIPANTASTEERLATLSRRSLPPRQLTEHWRLTRLSGEGLPAWSLSHPYELPPLGMQMTPTPRDKSHSPPIPWNQRPARPLRFPWVELEESLQWRAFLNACQILEGRGNRVHVLVGALNEHMLSTESLDQYEDLRRSVVAQLRENAITFDSLSLLPPEQYGDASHPLAAGYQTISRQLEQSPTFSRFINNRDIEK